LNRKVIIQNRAGLHARPISKFVEIASKFKSNLTVRCNGQDVDGKSIIQLMTLAANCGAELELISEGQDSETLLDSLEALILSGFEEG
jgi:phosphotransferase system HPr (HPr) family protein